MLFAHLAATVAVVWLLWRGSERPQWFAGAGESSTPECRLGMLSSVTVAQTIF